MTAKIRSNVVMANLATLAGHVVVEDYAVIGGIVAIHQFTRIGTYAMVGASAVWDRTYLLIQWRQAQRAKLFGLNSIGLKRNNFSDTTINDLKKAYRILFREKHTLKDALKRFRKNCPRQMR